MKLVTRIALGFLVLLVAGISIVVLRARMARHADEAYHAGLAKTIIVGSKNFDANATIPLEYTCRGRGSSPQVQWDHVPIADASGIQKAMRGHIIAFGEIDGVVEH